MTKTKVRFCALSGVRLDDGDPLHRGVQRIVRDGRVEWVALTVAHAIDGCLHWVDVERHVATMQAREARGR